MQERIKITPKKEFLLHYYSDFYHEAASRLGHRVMYDAYDIPIKSLPIGGSEGLSKILNFLPEITKTYENDNFYSLLNFDPDPKLLTDKENLFDSYLSSYLKKLNENKNPNKTLLADHVLITLCFLQRNRRVNFQTLEMEGSKYEFCDDDSLWLDKLTPDVIGKTLKEIQQSTKLMLCTSDGAPYRNELRAAHFFAAGYKTMRSILPKEEKIIINAENFIRN